jgi:ABC-type sugar transport system ATPase subunit
VAIGRAIVREPDVFLFDEPLSNLDAALRVSTRVEIARLHRLLGATMVYVTHDQIEAMTLADRIVVMNEGRIEQIGKALDLYYAPANLFVAGFIGSPAMNFFSGAVESVDGDVARVVGAGVGPLALPAGGLDRGAKITVGVRPEHLRIAADGPFTAGGVVELVERLGEASFAHVRRTDDKMLVVEIRGRETPSVSDTVTFHAPLQDIHVFDASGQRIADGHPPRREPL